jgi:tyrosyl-tRNA synthetase
MSKTYKNFVGVNEDANSMFVKLMEINDDLIIRYFEHCTELYLDEIKVYEDRLNEGENPRNVKMDLAVEIISFYHSKEKALEAKTYFERTISE